MKFKLMGLIAVLLLTSCSEGGFNSPKGPGQPMPFEGTWLAQDFLEFRETKDPQIICDSMELSNGKLELRIDGLVIDRAGNVMDFRINDKAVGPMWKVRADGTVYDSIFMNRTDDEGTMVLSQSMKLVDQDHLVKFSKFKIKSGEILEGEVDYYRVTESEVNEVRDIFNKCPKN